jgi:hypothetical protein
MGVYTCNRSTPLINDKTSYMESVEQWQKDRLEDLKAGEMNIVNH